MTLSYTEKTASFSIGADGAWTDYDLFTLQDVPKGAIAEIVVTPDFDTADLFAGVRTDGSGIDRRIELHEAEGGGVTTATMLVKCDPSTGLIECYAQSWGLIDFYLLGYFEGCDFTEAFTALGNPPQVWTDLDLSAHSVPANAVVQILTGNLADADTNFAGVRENGSGLERGITLDEAEDGGYSTLSFIVQADGSSIIDWKAGNATDVDMWLLGWFSNVVGFTEGWTEYSPATDNTWESKTIAEADADSIVAFALVNEDSGKQEENGLRPEGSAINRYILEHESEGGGNSGFQACVTLDADKKCEVFCGDASEANFYYTGFFSDIGVAAEWKQLEYFTEPPTGGQWNRLRYEAEPPVAGAWNRVKYKP